jgi:ParB family chromosome partitioning protein
MKADKSEAPRPEPSRPAGKPSPSIPPAATPHGVTRLDVSVGELLPDPDNRAIDERDEAFQTLLDSVRVMGVLVALQAQRRSDGRYHLLDGERRWRAAQRAGLTTIPCDVWPEHALARDLVLAGIVINEHRQAHACLAVARRLRSLRNQFAETYEQVAVRSGLPLARVKAYLGLFQASDEVLGFLEEVGLPLRTAAEVVRFEKALGEREGRRLLERLREEALGCRDIELLRKKAEARQQGLRPGNEPKPQPGTKRSLTAQLEAAFRRDAAATRRELELVAAQFGLRLVPRGEADSPSSP